MMGEHSWTTVLPANKAKNMKELGIIKSLAWTDPKNLKLGIALNEFWEKNSGNRKIKVGTLKRMKSTIRGTELTAHSVSKFKLRSN